jgi:hypothetical protein
VRLEEIGPRMTLRLATILDGFCSGKALYALRGASLEDGPEVEEDDADEEAEDDDDVPEEDSLRTERSSRKSEKQRLSSRKKKGESTKRHRTA